MHRQDEKSISVTVKPVFLDKQSSPDQKHFVWLYKIIIENNGASAVQLLNRYWHVCDESGQIEEIQSLGSAGDQPLIEPGQSFQYQSGCPLQTPSGIMTGHFEMRRDDGSYFIVSIPSFSLDSPYQKITIN